MQAQFEKYKRARLEAEAIQKKRLEAGRDLFGVDKMWADRPFHDTLSRKEPSDFRVGDFGFVGDCLRVIQKVDDNVLLVYPGFPKDMNEPVLLHGLDCSKVADGVEFILQRPVAITGTESYTTVAGSKKTVFRLDCDEEQVSNLIAAQLAKDAEAGFRTWTLDRGKTKVVARLLESKGNWTNLEYRDGSTKMVLTNLMIAEDRKYIREEVKRRTSKSQVSRTHQSPSKAASTGEGREHEPGGK